MLNEIINWYYIFIVDNSGIPPALSSIPVIQSPMKYKIGSTVIRIQAQDLAGNVQKCQFTITVLGKRAFTLITYVQCLPLLIKRNVIHRAYTLFHIT